MSGNVRKLGLVPLHDPETGPDAQVTLVWSGGELIRIEKVVGEHEWHKTLTWVGGYPTVISDWVKQ